ncbi:HD-GYP domain-containing protein [candidate division KSB1 bacterium]|nr:HD-GYP domain-containing protein [candidate division KSB1 bacterium]
MIRSQLPLVSPTDKVIIGLEAFFILSLLVEIFSIPLISSRATISVIHPVIWAMIVIFGPVYAMLIAIATSFIYEFQVKKDHVTRIYASIAQQIISVSSAGMVYIYAGGIVGSEELTKMILPFTASVIVYFILNSILSSCLTAFDEDLPPIAAWQINYRWMVPYEVALIPVGILIVFIYQYLFLAGLILFLIPLLIIRRSYSLNLDLKKTYKETVQALVKTIEAHDSYTSGHSLRVAQYCKMIAKAVKLPYYEQEKLEIAAYLHDLGKIAASFSSNVLNHEGKLDDKLIQQKMMHLQASDRLISSISVLKDVGEIVRYHHERFDGSGYPDGLAGEAIPFCSRILMIADAFDAMTSDRPYRKALSLDEAIDELESNKGAQFDPRLVDVFVAKCIHPKRKAEMSTEGMPEQHEMAAKLKLVQSVK